MDDLATEYADAIMASMEAVSQRRGAGSMNAAIGALTTTMAGLISTVREETLQRALLEAVERTLPDELERLSGKRLPFVVVPVKFEGRA